MAVRTLTLGLAVTLLATLATADPPATPPKPTAAPTTPPDPKELTTEILQKNKALAEQYAEFEAALTRVANRMERSSKPEDQQKAKALMAALQIAASDTGVDTRSVERRFQDLIKNLSKGKLLDEQDASDAITESAKLSETLRKIIAVLMTEDDSLRRKEEIKRLEDLMKEMNKVIFAQKQERAKTEAGKEAGKKLAESQKPVTGKTEKLADAMGKKESKPGDPKKGEPKKGEPKEGKPKEGQPKEGQPKEGDPKQQPPQQQMPGQEQVKKAIEKQKNAEQQLEQDNKKKGSNAQDEAIKNLEEAKKELEKRLKQLREEERAQLLKNLEARCNEMLKLQIEVYDGTVRVDSAVKTLPDAKPTNSERQKSQELADKEARLVGMAKEGLELLAEEGTAVAFTLVFESLRDDMTTVRERLERCDVADFTQNIEKEIINQLKEAIEALKKAQQEMKDRKNSPPPPPGGPPPDPRLFNLLSELKIIRFQQLTINKRTVEYAKEYSGEQADDLKIRKELTGLAQRQLKIQEATKNIATGKNQ